ncbi:MAG TPA: LCP family protein [Patescibacteria group bacterium]|nr:LCP family protein [Patescibacteria group bacterium]
MNLGPKQKPKKAKKALIWTSVIFGIILIAWLAAFGISSIFNFFNQGSASKSPFLNLISRVTGKSDAKLNGEDADRVNVLLLGMPGSGHQGPELTDTIMILSIKPSENKAALISIPRDLYVKAPGTSSYVKINSVYALGKEKANNAKNSTTKHSLLIAKAPENGYEYLKQTITDVTDLPIHYYIKMDFVGFENIVDELGGIDIYVEKNLYDPYYPTDNYGYQTLKISKGQQHMSGSLALKYARSRETSSDFDRAKRQQQVLTAIKDKAVKLSFFDVGKIIKLLKIIDQHFTTDLSFKEVERLVTLTKNIDRSKIINKVFDNSTKGVLKSATYNGMFVLIPKAGIGDYDQIQLIAKNIFETGNVESEAAKIEVKNGSTTVGLATTTANLLKKEGLNIINVTNAEKTSTTKIIDYTSGAKPATLKLLQQLISAQVSQQNPASTTQADIIIILGADFQSITSSSSSSSGE